MAITQSAAASAASCSMFVAGPGVVRLGHFLRAIVPIWGEVYRFKGRAQLRGPRRNGTFVPSLSHNHVGVI